MKRKIYLVTRLCFVMLCVGTIIFQLGYATANQACAETDSNTISAFYNMGIALPLTGAGAFYSKDGIDAIKLAVKEINAKGGFLGKYPIQLFIRDTQTKPEIAALEATGMILRDHVRCILGTYSSACAIAVKPEARKNKVLHIAAISNSENLTMNDFSPYTFSVVPNTYMQAKAVALGIARLAKEKKWKEYVTIASDYEWGKSTQQNFVQQLAKVAPELKLKKEIWTPLGETRFSPYIATIISLKPDFVYGSLASRDNMVWMKTAEKYDFFKKFPYPGSLISVSELISQKDTIQRNMIGLCRAPFFAHPDIQMMKDFVKNFRETYQRYPSDWAVMEYDSVYILKQGIEKAGTVDSEKVKDTLRGMTVDTTRGRLFFREIDNQLSCSSYMGVISDVIDYPFPIYKDIIEIKGPESWRSEEEIMKIRNEELGMKN